MMALPDIDTHLRKVGFFEEADDTFFKNLTEKSRVISAIKGQVLFIHEEPAESFYMILKGWVKLYRETLYGAQAVVDILNDGHLFGETSLFHDDLYPYSAEATEATEILALPISVLKKEIENNPKLALAMLSAMARYRKHQDQELEHRTLQNAPQRIGCFLLRLADQTQTGPVTIHLPYDKTLVASRLGMQPETFSRALGKLKDATGIQVKGATIVMDSLDQLSDFSCMACSSEFPCNDLKSVKGLQAKSS